MNIYVTRDGQTYGPYAAEQAHAMIQQGQLSVGDLACPEGANQWVPLGQVLGIPPAAAPQPAVAVAPAPAAPALRPAIPVAQPATAVPVPGTGPSTVPIAPGGVAPGAASAQFALRQAYQKASGACTQSGLAAALAVIGLGLPLIAWSAGGSGFFGKTLGVKVASFIGLPLAALCLCWFFAAKGKAASAKANFEAMRRGMM